MNTFKRKSLYAALAGLGALGVTGSANAVYVNPDGLGQVLLYPYYTVRSVGGSEFNTYLSVVNTQNTVKVAKVRFLEGRNSKEVLDFNLYLSPYDVWTAAIVPTAGGAQIITADRSCTHPAIPSTGQEFRNIAYAQLFPDVGGTSLDRTREGYFEIIEMGNVFGPVATAATHNAAGTPNNCTLVRSTVPPPTTPGRGGLFGNMALINVTQGTDYTANAVALDNFNNTDLLYSGPGELTPNLDSSFPRVSVVTNSEIVGSTSVNRTYITDWTATPFTINPVSAVLMHDQIFNEFALDTQINARTDWVITFPTKTFYYNQAAGSLTLPTPLRAPATAALFQRNFVATGACDDVLPTVFSREEQTTVLQDDFSPRPIGGTSVLCWEANVLQFGGSAGDTASSVLGSRNFSQFSAGGFANGWLNLAFPNGTSGGTNNSNNHRLVAPAGATTLVSYTLGPVAVTTTTLVTAVTYFGLPVIGFAVQSYVNGTITVGGNRVLSNYGGNWVHSGTRRIQ